MVHHDQPMGNHYFNMGLAIFSLGVIIVGTLLPISLSQKIIFAAGVGLLDVSAILERQIFFMGLQTISFIGTLVAFLTIPTLYKASIPILLTLFATIYFIFSGTCRRRVAWLGLLGLFGLALGLATSMPLFYCAGGIFIVLFSYADTKTGNRLAWVFLALNLLFAITSAIGTIRWLVG